MFSFESLILNLQESTLIENSAIAGIIVIFGILAAHFFSRIVSMILLKLGLLEKLKEKGMKNPAWILETGIRYLIYIVAIYFALTRLRLFEPVFSIALIVIGIIILIIIVFEFKDFIVNFTSGLIMLSKNQFKVGDIIKLGDLEGEVKEISITETKIITKKDDLIIIPNYFIVRSKIELKESDTLKK